MNLNTVRKLTFQALYGKTPTEREEARERIIRENARMARKANSRMRDLEKAGKTYWAYSRAYEFNDRKGTRKGHFSKSRRILRDITDVAASLEEAIKFVDSKSSTVEGIKMIESEIIETFKLQGLKLPEGQEQEFLDLLASDDWGLFKKVMGSSPSGSINEIVRLSNEKDVDISTIRELMADYAKGQKSYDDILSDYGIPFKITYDEDELV